MCVEEKERSINFKLTILAEIWPFEFFWSLISDFFWSIKGYDLAQNTSIIMIRYY